MTSITSPTTSSVLTILRTTLKGTLTSDRLRNIAVGLLAEAHRMDGGPRRTRGDEDATMLALMGLPTDDLLAEVERRGLR